MLVFILSLLACSGDTSNSQGATLLSDTGQSIVPLKDPAQEVHMLLQGDFDSTRQASNDPGYYEISLRMCSFELTRLGENLLYVEQAAVSDAANPYRQRVYSVVNMGDRVVSHVYAIESMKESDLVGACDDPTSIQIEMDQLSQRVGCSVWLDEIEDGYAGGTEGADCSSSLGDAAYATSEVVVSPTQIESLDRGWTSSGQQAWGATDGPYIFDRLN